MVEKRYGQWPVLSRKQPITWACSSGTLTFSSMRRPTKSEVSVEDDERSAGLSAVRERRFAGDRFTHRSLFSGFAECRRKLILLLCCSSGSLNWWRSRFRVMCRIAFICLGSIAELRRWLKWQGMWHSSLR